MFSTLTGMKRTSLVLVSSAALLLGGLPGAVMANAASPAPTPPAAPVTLSASGSDVLMTPAKRGKRAKTAKGLQGNKIRVNRVRNLSPFGTTVTVSGRGFAENVGVYVALCKKRPKGKKPGPCGGGADMDGSSQASAWISSNPPPYGKNLATPYKRGGKFKVRIKVSSRIGNIDCRVKRCAVVVRADHLNSNDRRWDLQVPVRFR